MTTSPLLRGLVMAIHPHSHGFAWVVFEAPIVPADWGIVEIKKDRNARCLTRIQRIMERYEPAVVILEQFDKLPARRSARVKALCTSIGRLAANRSVELYVYSRAAVRTCFVSAGARTRYEIANAIAIHIEVLRRHLPPTRRAWQSEDHRQSLFDAAALAITHFAIKGHGPSFAL